MIKLEISQLRANKIPRFAIEQQHKRPALVALGTLKQDEIHPVTHKYYSESGLASIIMYSALVDEQYGLTFDNGQSLRALLLEQMPEQKIDINNFQCQARIEQLLKENVKDEKFAASVLECFQSYSENKPDIGKYWREVERLYPILQLKARVYAKSVDGDLDDNEAHWRQYEQSLPIYTDTGRILTVNGAPLREHYKKRWGEDWDLTSEVLECDDVPSEKEASRFKGNTYVWVKNAETPILLHYSNGCFKKQVDISQIPEFHANDTPTTVVQRYHSAGLQKRLDILLKELLEMDDSELRHLKIQYTQAVFQDVSFVGELIEVEKNNFYFIILKKAQGPSDFRRCYCDLSRKEDKKIHVEAFSDYEAIYDTQQKHFKLPVSIKSTVILQEDAFEFQNLAIEGKNDEDEKFIAALYQGEDNPFLHKKTGATSVEEAFDVLEFAEALDLLEFNASTQTIFAMPTSDVKQDELNTHLELLTKIYLTHGGEKNPLEVKIRYESMKLDLIAAIRANEELRENDGDFQTVCDAKRYELSKERLEKFQEEIKAEKQAKNRADVVIELIRKWIYFRGQADNLSASLGNNQVHNESNEILRKAKEEFPEFFEKIFELQIAIHSISLEVLANENDFSNQENVRDILQSLYEFELLVRDIENPASFPSFDNIDVNLLECLNKYHQALNSTREIVGFPSGLQVPLDSCSTTIKAVFSQFCHEEALDSFNLLKAKGLELKDEFSTFIKVWGILHKLTQPQPDNVILHADILAQLTALKDILLKGVSRDKFEDILTKEDVFSNENANNTQKEAQERLRSIFRGFSLELAELLIPKANVNGALVPSAIQKNETVFNELTQLFFYLQDQQYKILVNTGTSEVAVYSEEVPELIAEPLKALKYHLLPGLLDELHQQKNNLREKTPLNEGRSSWLEQHVKLHELSLSLKTLESFFIDKAYIDNIEKVEDSYKEFLSAKEFVLDRWKGLNGVLSILLGNINTNHPNAFMPLLDLSEQFLKFIREKFFRFYHPDLCKENIFKQNFIRELRKYENNFNEFISSITIKNYPDMPQKVLLDINAVLTIEKQHVSNEILPFYNEVTQGRLDKTSHQWEKEVEKISEIKNINEFIDEVGEENDDSHSRIANGADDLASISSAESNIENSVFYRNNKYAYDIVTLFGEATKTIIKDLTEQRERLLRQDLIIDLQQELEAMSAKNHPSSSVKKQEGDDLLVKRGIIDIAIKQLQKEETGFVSEDQQVKVNELIASREKALKTKLPAVLKQLNAVAAFQEKLLTEFFPTPNICNSDVFLDCVKIQTSQLKNLLTNINQISRKYYPTQNLKKCKDAADYVYAKVYNRANYFNAPKIKYALALAVAGFKIPNSLWNPLNTLRWSFSSNYRKQYKENWANYNLIHRPKGIPLTLKDLGFGNPEQEKLFGNEKQRELKNKVEDFLLGEISEEKFIIELEKSVVKQNPGSLWLPWNWGWTKEKQQQREYYNCLVEIFTHVQSEFLTKVQPQRIRDSYIFYNKLAEGIDTKYKSRSGLLKGGDAELGKEPLCPPDMTYSDYVRKIKGHPEFCKQLAKRSLDSEKVVAAAEEQERRSVFKA